MDTSAKELDNCNGERSSNHHQLDEDARNKVDNIANLVRDLVSSDAVMALYVALDMRMPPAIARCIDDYNFSNKRNNNDNILSTNNNDRNQGMQHHTQSLLLQQESHRDLEW